MMERSFNLLGVWRSVVRTRPACPFIKHCAHQKRCLWAGKRHHTWKHGDVLELGSHLCCLESRGRPSSQAAGAEGSSRRAVPSGLRSQLVCRLPELLSEDTGLLCPLFSAKDSEQHRRPSVSFWNSASFLCKRHSLVLCEARSRTSACPMAGLHGGVPMPVIQVIVQGELEKQGDLTGWLLHV